MLKTVPAPQLSRLELISFLNADNLTFRHLDWLSPRDRIDEPSCIALTLSEELLALFSCEPENQQAAWLRFFISRRDGQHARYFSLLLSDGLEYLRSVGVPELYAIAVHDWLEVLLTSNGFEVDTQVVTLVRSNLTEPDMPNLPSLTIRSMTARDLAEVQSIDQKAFPPAWQLNPVSLQKAYLSSSHPTVALVNQQLVGYQTSTSTFTSSHLARLAVAPAMQGKHIGEALVSEMIRDFTLQGISEITVNTQMDNLASLKLYQKLDFLPQGPLFPVYKKWVN